MVNSKGGFLVDDEKEVTDDLRIKERERERQRAMQNLEPRTCLTVLYSEVAVLTGKTASNIFGPK